MSDLIDVLLNRVGETQRRPTEVVWTIPDSDAYLFYRAEQEWTAEEYDELVRRGRERLGVDVEELVRRGREYSRDHDPFGDEGGGS